MMHFRGRSGHKEEMHFAHRDEGNHLNVQCSGMKDMKMLDGAASVGRPREMPKKEFETSPIHKRHQDGPILRVTLLGSEFS